MHHVRQEELPFVGSRYEFVGAEQWNTGVSVFLFYGKAGSGPGPHRHRYDEIHLFGPGNLDGKRPDVRGQGGRYLCHQGRRDP